MSKAMISLEEAAAIVGIGKNSRYRAAKAGELCPGVPIVKVGGLYRVPVAPLEHVLGTQLVDRDAVPA